MEYRLCNNTYFSLLFFVLRGYLSRRRRAVLRSGSSGSVSCARGVSPRRLVRKTGECSKSVLYVRSWATIRPERFARSFPDRASAFRRAFFRLAGEFCPAESIVQQGYLDYVREDYGESITASDDAYLISTLEEAVAATETSPGGCPVHTSATTTDPDDPNAGLDPSDPNWQPPDPNNPEEPTDPDTPTEDPSGGDSGGDQPTEPDPSDPSGGAFPPAVPFPP